VWLITACQRISPEVTEGFYEVLRIQCSRWDWWRYVVEWQWRGWECRSECEKDEGTDCGDGDSDTDW